MKKFLLIMFVISSVLLASVPMTALAQSSTGTGYSDISAQWFTDAAAKYGYTEIFSDGSGKFYPNKDITRIEFVRQLHQALGISINYFAAPDVSKDFSDMKNTDIGAGDLIDLVTAGIVESGGSFNPNKPLDRDLMVHWILQALLYETDSKYPIPKVKPVPFKDDADIADAYRGEVYSSVVLKLVYGRGDNMLFPRDGATRAEAATMVMRLTALLDNYKAKVSVTAFASNNNGTLKMTLNVLNATDKTVTINHTSGMKYDFKLFDGNGNNIYTWSADKSFAAVMGATVLKPGESILFSDTLDSSVFLSINSAVQLKAYLIGTSTDFTIDENGYMADIVK
jgi:hypothetical protein